MAITASSELVIGQWVGSPRLRGVIDAAVNIIKAEAEPALAQLKLMREIDTAKGVWLDYLGTRLGLKRPATTDPAQDERFGFDMAGKGFDQAPFRGDSANDAVYPLPDAVYRKLLRARAILLLGDGTIQTFIKAVRAIDPGAAVQDQRNMVVRVVTSMRSFLELADTSNALPRSAGVRIEYADRGRFGFDLAGVGFDQGPFAGE